jgi:hypothetical protein
MPGGKKQKGLREGATPSKHFHKVIISPKEYDNLIIATAKNIAKIMR